MNAHEEELARLHTPVNNVDETTDTESIGINVTATNCLVRSVAVTFIPTESTQTNTIRIFICVLGFTIRYFTNRSSN